MPHETLLCGAAAEEEDTHDPLVMHRDSMHTAYRAGAHHWDRARDTLATDCKQLMQFLKARAYPAFCDQEGTNRQSLA